MGFPISVTGMVLLAAPVNEYDRRLVLLTRERGKITVFARGARRPSSPFMAVSNPFSFGTFQVYETRTAYNLGQAEISNYFREVREDFSCSCYGQYFMEFADYYAREGVDESQMLNLLYASLRALAKPEPENRLVRYVFECKAMAVNGEFPWDTAEDMQLKEGTRCAFSYVLRAPIQRLYTFTLSPEILDEFARRQDRIRERLIDKRFHALDFLKSIDLI